MDSDNKFENLRGLFSDEKTDLPDDLKWEFMEDAIMDKMKKDKTSKRPIFILVFILVFISLTVFGLRWSNIYHNSDILKATKFQELNNESSGKHVVFSSDSLFASLKNEQSGLSATFDIDQRKQNKDGKSFRQENQKTIVETKVPVTILREEVVNLKPSLNKDGFQLMKVKINDAVQGNKTENNRELSNEKARFSSSDIIAQNLKKTTSTTDESGFHSINTTETTLTSLPHISMKEVKSLENDSCLILFEPSLTKQQPAILPKNYVALSGGLSFWDMNYGSVLPERQPYEQTILSYHSQLSYTHRFGNNFTIMTGIRLQKMETLLDWNSYIENYTTRTFKDTIIGIYTNSVTGQQSQIRGDVEVNVNATRQVQHYNQYQLYQIPFTVGKVWSISKKWFADLSLGGALNIFSFNNGRNLYQGKIIDFDHSSTPFIDNRWGFQVMGSVKLNYRINKHYGLLLDAGVQKSLTNWSKEAKIQMQPLIKNIGIGISYSF